MNSNKEFILNLRDAKIFGITTVMVISTLAGGAAYSSKVDTDIEEAMVLIEDNKLSYQKYFSKVYTETLITGQVDLHIWEELLNKSEDLYKDLLNVKQPQGTFNIANKDRPYLEKYLQINASKQKTAERLINSLRKEVESSKILTGNTRRVYELRNNKNYFELIKEYKIFVENL